MRELRTETIQIMVVINNVKNEDHAREIVQSWLKEEDPKAEIVYIILYLREALKGGRDRVVELDAVEMEMKEQRRAAG